MSANAIRSIAVREFSNLVRNPLVIVTVVVLCILVLVNGAGCSITLPIFKRMGYSDVFMVGVGNTFHNTSLILSFLSLCMGIISIAGERSNGSIRVLLTKPVYRRDVIAGKFLGINALILLLATFILVVCVSSVMVSYGGPESTIAILKLLTYVFLLYVFCSIMAGMMLLFGIIFKDLSVALVFSVSYLYLSWFVEAPASLQGVQMALSPVILYMNAIMGSSYLLESFSPVSYAKWLSARHHLSC